MCLIISNQSKVLKFYHWNVGYKNFLPHSNKLYNLVKQDQPYIFSVVDNSLPNNPGRLLVAKPNDQLKNVWYDIKIQYALEHYFKEYVFRSVKMGYHISQFSDEWSVKICFEIFKSRSDVATLPIFFKNEEIQMIGEYEIAVSQFGVPDHHFYVELCEYYEVKPKEEMINFLENLFKSYS